MEPLHSFAIRPMTVDDLPAADALRAQAGWNQTLADWRRLLTLEPHGCFVKRWRNELHGTATITCYGHELAWIGMVLVEQKHRNQGIGRALVERCLAEIDRRGIRCARLDATPAGRPVYERIGFVPEWPLTRWVRAENAAPPPPPPKSAISLRDATAEDWDTLAGVDRGVFGADRLRLLTSLAQDSHTARVITDGAQPKGVAMLRSGASADYLGPVVAASTWAGRTLVLDLLSRPCQRPLFWDIPDANHDAVGLAAELGFQKQRRFVRMRRGGNCPAADPLLQWGIADPSVG